MMRVVFLMQGVFGTTWLHKHSLPNVVRARDDMESPGSSQHAVTSGATVSVAGIQFRFCSSGHYPGEEAWSAAPSTL